MEAGCFPKTVGAEGKRANRRKIMVANVNYTELSTSIVVAIGPNPILKKSTVLENVTQGLHFLSYNLLDIFKNP